MGESQRQVEEESWTQGGTLLPPAEEEGQAWIQLDGGVTLEGCGSFLVTLASVLFVTQEVG